MIRLLALLVPAIALAAPTVDATLDDDRDLLLRVTNTPSIDPDVIRLRVDNEPGIPPRSSTPYDRIAIAFVISGQEIWIGNDLVEPDEAARYEGVFPELADGFDRVVRDFEAPPGSTVTVISYADRVEVRVPETQLAMLPVGSLGTQRDYRGRYGAELVRGIERGIIELERSPAPIKHLIVIGDGKDTNPDTAAPRLRELTQRAAARHIALHHIELRLTTHRREPSADPTLVFAPSAPEAARHLQAILDAIAGRVLLEFPSTALRFDGRVHAIELDLGFEQVRFRFEMPDERAVPQASARTSTPLVAGLCLAGLAALWLVLKRRRSCARGRSPFGGRPLA